jgi:hypothetical protein
VRSVFPSNPSSFILCFFFWRVFSPDLKISFSSLIGVKLHQFHFTVSKIDKYFGWEKIIAGIYVYK